MPGPATQGHSTAPLRTVKRVQFGIFSPDELVSTIVFSLTPGSPGLLYTNFVWGNLRTFVFIIIIAFQKLGFTSPRKIVLICKSWVVSAFQDEDKLGSEKYETDKPLY